LITRRGFFRLLGLGAAAAFFTGIYATAVEPFLIRRIKRNKIKPSNWPQGVKLKVAVLADIHACEPWMPVRRIEQIVKSTNALGADVILLLGDYTSAMKFSFGPVEDQRWAEALGRLNAPLGVYGVLGNHDWWADEEAQKAGKGPVKAQRALEAAGITVLENDVFKIEKGKQSIWLAGLGDQIALLPNEKYGRSRWKGVDDLDGTLAKIEGDGPVILMAHEPDIFPKVPDRVALTLSGHTHGGQIRLFGWSPVVPSRFKNRYAYGYVVEDGRNLVISAGLGISIFPIRFGVPPEINLIEIG
jgi:predicted MPP superfamily phosphohydrolase